MESLKEKDLELLEVINAGYSTNGYAPSMAEAAESMGMSKGSVISDMFKRLEAEGLIQYTPNRKSYVPTGWRELIVQPEKFDITAEVERRVQEVKAELEKDFDKRVAAEVIKRFKKSPVSPELEKIRENNRARVDRWRKKQKKNKKV